MLTAVLGLAVAGLSQCRMVDDTVTGVELNASGTLSARSKCKKECDKTYKAEKKAEDARHKAADKACGKKDKACKETEKDLHKNNSEAIKDRKEECKRGCYNEGAGGGGR